MLEHLKRVFYAQTRFPRYAKEKSHARIGIRKVDLKVVQEDKKLAQNPLIGA